MKTVSVLTLADLHQSKELYAQLASAVNRHRPQAVAFVGDFLNVLEPLANRDQYGIEELASQLSQLPAQHLIFIRGNHEDQNWFNFVYCWPFEKRPLIALYGTSFSLGPLAIVGFPCRMGWEEPWCESLPKTGNELSLDPAKTGRQPLRLNVDKWLPKLMRNLGPSATQLWLMHEPPVQHPLARAMTCNPQWKTAVEQFSPLVTVSGHDHEAPLENKMWHVQLGKTLCVNVGQQANHLHYCLLEFEFGDGPAGLPVKVSVAELPSGKVVRL